MKAVVLREVDGPLSIEEVPEPDGDHVVEVRAAGVNFADILIRRGTYPQMPELPFVPGSEIAGELNITVRTVKAHVGSILAKLDVQTRAGAAARGRHEGLVLPRALRQRQPAIA